MTSIIVASETIGAKQTAAALYWNTKIVLTTGRKWAILVCLTVDCFTKSPYALKTLRTIRIVCALSAYACTQIAKGAGRTVGSVKTFRLFDADPINTGILVRAFVIRLTNVQRFAKTIDANIARATITIIVTLKVRFAIPVLTNETSKAIEIPQAFLAR